MYVGYMSPARLGPAVYYLVGCGHSEYGVEINSATIMQKAIIGDVGLFSEVWWVKSSRSRQLYVTNGETHLRCMNVNDVGTLCITEIGLLGSY